MGGEFVVQFPGQDEQPSGLCGDGAVRFLGADPVHGGRQRLYDAATGPRVQGQGVRVERGGGASSRAEAATPTGSVCPPRQPRTRTGNWLMR